ncbi:MAG: CHAT domain-containing protein, partial [Bacteroidota bacterium]
HADEGDLLVISPPAGGSQTASGARSLGGALPFGEKESAFLFDRYRSQTWQANQISLSRFSTEAARSKVLHLSTHAQVDGADPMLGSFIMLGPEGRMPLLEVLQLRLKADMVVLSACETAAGPLMEGEGILSLARGFFVAGARSLVSTRWSVNDAATASIMQQYYLRLDQGLSKPEALHRAQQAWLDQTDHLMAHPYFWAGFSLLGHTDPIYIRPASSFPYRWIAGCILALLGMLGFGWCQKAIIRTHSHRFPPFRLPGIPTQILNPNPGRCQIPLWRLPGLFLMKRSKDFPPGSHILPPSPTNSPNFFQQN